MALKFCVLFRLPARLPVACSAACWTEYSRLKRVVLTRIQMLRQARIVASFGSTRPRILSPTKHTPHPRPNPLPRTQLRPHIQIKARPQAHPSTFFPRVKVDDILHPLPTPINNPIVPIKGLFIPSQPIKPSPGCQFLAVTREGDEFWAAAVRGVGFFVGFDVVPCALVHGVVDGHDSLHIRGCGCVAFAFHRFEEHVLGGVDPVATVSVMAGVAFAIRWCCCRFGGVEGVSVVVCGQRAGY